MTDVFKMLRAALIALLLLGILPAGALAQISAGQFQPQYLNVLDNGNFNIAQRGTTAVSSITTSAKYLWDRWAAYSGASTSLTLTDVTTTLPAGFSHAAQIQRDSAQVGTANPFLVQEIPTADVLPLAGQQVTLSFWMRKGANFSGPGNITIVKMTTGTGTDEGLATLISGWAGAATPLLQAPVVTANWQRFSFTATLGATATEAAVQIGWLPISSAGANDYLQVTGVQLELGQVASNFEWRSAPLELAKVQAYAYGITDGAATVRYGNCQVITANTTAVCGIQLPRQMRAVPTLTIGTAASFGLTSATGSALTCTNLVATTSGQSVNRISLTCTTGGTVAITVPSEFIGQATAGTLLATADF